ncbi:MAG TPA: CoA ester lyase [Sphingomonadaceae bacterium]|nr:CoA ester lyase [Sphingomonadaceae bacterium]
MTAPPPRSWLFVPADSEKKIGKALASEADAVILDLEDSVAAGRKKDAREIAAAALAQAGSGPQRWVRINPLDSGLAEDDLAAVGALAIAGVVLPKAESGEDVARLAAMLGRDLRIHAVATETAASLFGLGTYADAPRLAAMSWGAEDLSAALGAASKYDAGGGLSFTYRMARSLCLAGAAAAGVQPVDGVFADFRDAEGLRAEAAAARREGFTGKLAIHPDQVGPINAAFTPSDAEVGAAERIVALFAANPDAGTLALDGRMLDRPHLLQAERLLARRR